MLISTVRGIAKLTALVGFAIVCFGLLFTAYVNTTTLCFGLLCQTGQICNSGCGIDYSPLIIPSIVGGALIVMGAWVFFVERPHGSTPPSLPSSQTVRHVYAGNIRRFCSRPKTVLGSSDRTRSQSRSHYLSCR